MREIFCWLNDNSGGISALATAITAWLTFSLRKSTRVQSEVAVALREIEFSRDLAEDPRVFIWFNGYNTFNETGGFVMQNSGRRSLFLQSLKIVSSGMDVEFFDLEINSEKKERITSGGELRDLVITPEKIERFFFKFKNGRGQHLELVAQLYTGQPVRLTLDPNKAIGYELSARQSKELIAKVK